MTNTTHLLDEMEQLKARVRRVASTETALLGDALAAIAAIGTGGQHIGRAVRVSRDHMERVQATLRDLRKYVDDMP